jgi:hypothetical protein
MKAIFITLVLLICTNCLLAQGATYKTTTAKVNAILYKAIYKNTDLSVSIVNPNGKIINHIDAGSVWTLKFMDFNGDGYEDLFIEYISNTPGDNDLLLYNKEVRRFIKVEDFGRFSSASRLRNSGLYYSYHRSGCADLNWDSDLFKIVNYKAIKIGNISGLGCEVDDKTGIFISKVHGTKEQLIKKYPISEINKYKNYKWGFIKGYWKRNYRKFI